MPALPKDLDWQGLVLLRAVSQWPIAQENVLVAPCGVGSLVPDYADIVQRARDCYKLVSEAERAQRQREKDDLLWQVAENQWDDAAQRERRGGIIDGVPTPERPMLSIDQTKHPIQLVNNSFLNSKLGVLLHPVSADATRELADAKQGLYRRIERDSNATQARAWALNRAVKAGRGWERIVTDYDEDGDDPLDQEIRVERILYQDNVYMDPAAQNPDCSDGKWCLYIAWMDAEEFAQEFPDAQISNYSSTFDWNQFEQAAPEWVRQETTGKRSVLVAEYWWKDIQVTKTKGPRGQERTSRQVTVYCAKMAGNELLEEPYTWPGKYIPFVPFYGEELIPVDGKRIWQGMIRPARDAQRAFNYGFTSLVERAAKEPKAPYMVDPKQIEGFESYWNQANTRDLPWLPFNSIVNGQVVPPPARAQLDTTGLSIAQIVLSTARDGVQAATAIYDPSLGKAESVKDSGRKVMALQQQGQEGSSQYVSQAAQVSMRYEAMVILDLMPHIYDRPGRVTRILTGEDDEKTVMLGVPFVRDGNGFPQQAPENHPQAETIDLSRGAYGISISVGKSPASQLEAGQQFLTELLGAYPMVAEFGLDLMFKYRDEPGSKEMAERSKKMIQSKFPFLFDEGNGGAEDAEAKVQALTAQLQQLQQQAQAMDQALKTDQAKQQAQVQIAQMEAQFKAQTEQSKLQAEVTIAQMNNAAKIEVARISAAKDTLNTQAAIQEEHLSTGLKIAAELAQTDVEHQHEERMAQQDREHQAGMANVEHAHDAEMGILKEPVEKPAGNGASK